MRTGWIAALLLTISTGLAAPVSAQPPDTAARGQIKIDDIVDRMNQSESAIAVRMRMYHPLVEVYIQNVVPDEQLAWVPTHDEYFLGQFDLGETPKLRPISQSRKLPGPGPLIRLARGNKNPQYLPDGFAAMAAPDWHQLGRDRYEFKFVRREFLGEARCFVFDVKPLHGSRDGFSGRIWVEDRDYHIVRFNGINRSVDQTLSSFFRRTLSFHVDGWRVNVLPGVWLPSYLYCEETDLSDTASTSKARFKSQVRIWAYETQGAEKTDQLTTIRLDEPVVVDNTEQLRQLSPVLSQRRWEQEAEANVIERLENIGLLAPPSDVDKVLDTVLNNLIVTNGIALERPLRCRILLTSPLESFTVGHTIVLSRGLIDVLPDEASLAMMIAHELSHVVLGHPLIDTKFAFADRLMVADGDLLPTLQFQHRPAEEAAADEKVAEILKKSPYSDKLADAGLFLRMIAERAKQLPRLIQPHIGNHIADGGQILRLGQMIQKAPPLVPTSLEQIPALPLGARIVVDPWSCRLALDRTPAVPLASVREKVPLAVTPLMPYLKYVEVIASR
jgi:hypothetical protein